VNPTKSTSLPTILEDEQSKGSIRTELLAHKYPLPQRELSIETLLKIQKVVDYMQRKGRTKNTLTGLEKHLKQIANRVSDIDNVMEVETAIARYKCIDPVTRKQTNRPASNCYKDKLVHIYNSYLKVHNLKWTNDERPVYTPEERSIQPPSTEKCEMLISYAKGSLSLKIDISMQTGLRPLEVVGEKGLRVKDFHKDQSTITALNTKGCNARPPLKISNELCARIENYITKNNLQPDDKLFNMSSKAYADSYRRTRNRLAEKMKDVSIRTIRLYDLRHYYVTKQLRKCQNAEIVRQIVGHKRLDTTQKYMHLTANTNTDLIVEQTNDRKRAAELTLAEFKYEYTTPDGYMTFTKPK
jgi:site-specific recombinase XerD